MQLILRAGTGGNISPSFYYSWKMPNDTGGDFYRDNIANCNMSIVTWNDPIIQEPGDMVGPTIQGIQMLIDKDPARALGHWLQMREGQQYQDRVPRVFPIPAVRPDAPRGRQGQRPGR